MSQNPLLVLENISLTYPGADSPVLKNINLSVDAGEFLVIRGKSGSGKTTLLHVLSLLRPPSSGRIWIQGEEQTQFTEEEHQKRRHTFFSYITQTPFFFNQLSVLDNVRWPLFYKKQVHTSPYDILKMLKIEKHISRLPWTLSGGEKQRVGIARALVSEPLILIADEPTGSLDPENTDNVLRLLSTFHDKGQTIILVTHSDAVTAYGSRVITMDQGMIVGDVRQKPLRASATVSSVQSGISSPSWKSFLTYLWVLIKLGVWNLKNQFLFSFLTFLGSFLGLLTLLLILIPLKTLDGLLADTFGPQWKTLSLYFMPDELASRVADALPSGHLRFQKEKGGWRMIIHQHPQGMFKTFAPLIFMDEDDPFLKNPNLNIRGQLFDKRDFQQCHMNALISSTIWDDLKHPDIAGELPEVLIYDHTQKQSRTVKIKGVVKVENSPTNGLILPLSCRDTLQGVRSFSEGVFTWGADQPEHFQFGDLVSIEQQLLGLLKLFAPQAKVYTQSFAPFIKGLFNLSRFLFVLGLIASSALIFFSFLNFFNLTFTQNKRRRREIALLKLLGGQSYDALWMFLCQNFLINFLTTVLVFGLMIILYIVSQKVPNLNLIVIPWGGVCLGAFGLFLGTTLITILATRQITEYAPSEIFD